MAPEEEIKAVADVVQTARDNADVHLKRAETDLHIGDTALAHYRDFLDASVLNARSILARCSDLVSVPAISAEPSTSNVVRGLLESVRESARLMYVAMIVLEQSAGPVLPGGPGSEPGLAPAPNEPAPQPGGRSCSFCGKTDAETRLVAGPVANICVSCTRLACGILGIAQGSRARVQGSQRWRARRSSPTSRASRCGSSTSIQRRPAGIVEEMLTAFGKVVLWALSVAGDDEALPRGDRSDCGRDQRGARHAGRPRCAVRALAVSCSHARAARRQEDREPSEDQGGKATGEGPSGTCWTS